jgi:hypothetical protein
MNRDETLHAARMLGSSPAAAWIGSKISSDGTRLFQKCIRCGAEEELEMPTAAVKAFQSGARGDAVARLVPPFFDEKLFAWKRDFQRAHESCREDKAA